MLKIHHCQQPEATENRWKAEEVWECHYCGRRYRIERHVEWYGFMSWRMRDIYRWVKYEGPVEQV